MKSIFKVFIISFVCFSLVIGASVFAFLKFYNPEPVINPIENNDKIEVVVSPGDEEDDTGKSDLQKLIEKSKRLNIVLLGMEGPRTDTIILASFDPVSKNVDLISIPRDTYFHSEGYNHPEQKKINAVYGRSGVNGTMSVVSHILGKIPIHGYIQVTYEGIENIVDSLGG